MNKKLIDILKIKENQIKNSKFEQAYVFDKQGNELLHKKGKKQSLEFTPDEQAIIKNQLFTHNHPSGAGFSVSDIFHAHNWNVIEFRAVCIDKVLRLQAPAMGWNLSEYTKIYNEFEPLVKSKYVLLLKRKKMKVEDVAIQFHREMVEILIQELGLDYKIEKL